MDSRDTSTRAIQNETDSAARALYDAEVHLHSARQSRVDEWIDAAAARLHDAVVRYEAALAAFAIVMTPLAA